MILRLETRPPSSRSVAARRVFIGVLTVKSLSDRLATTKVQRRRAVLLDERHRRWVGFEALNMRITASGAGTPISQMR